MGKKRKAPAATARSPYSAPSGTASRRQKKAKTSEALLEEGAAVPTTEEEQEPTGQDPPQSAAASRESSRYVTPPIKAEDVDNVDEESLDNIQYYYE